MKKEVTIKITLTDDNITLEGWNLKKLTEADIVDIIKCFLVFKKTLGITTGGDTTNGNAQIHY
jgi:hypothetical protein